MLHWLPVPVALLLLGGGSLAWHVRVWRREAGDQGAAERDFCRRQFRRRAFGSAALMLLAALMAGGMLLPPKTYPTAFLLCWYGAIALLFALMLSAMLDMAANRGRAVRWQREHLVARAQLEAQLKRLVDDADS